MRFWMYAAARVAVAAVAFGLIYLIGGRGIVLWGGAIIIAALVGYLAFSGPRRAAAEDLAGWFPGRRRDRATDGEEEDALLDASQEANGLSPERSGQEIPGEAGAVGEPGQVGAAGEAVRESGDRAAGDQAPPVLPRQRQED